MKNLANFVKIYPFNLSALIDSWSYKICLRYIAYVKQIQLQNFNPRQTVWVAFIGLRDYSSPLLRDY